MHSVNMDNNCARNEYSKNNSENSKEDSKTLQKSQGKGKKSNAYAKPMTVQEKSSAIDHFDGCTQWYTTKLVSEFIKYKHNAFQIGISPNDK